MIYTVPPVEAACTLCQVAADMCFEAQVYNPDQEAALASASGAHTPIDRLRGRSKEPLSVLGVVTLNDIDRLKMESATGRGWIACEQSFSNLPRSTVSDPCRFLAGTTDAIFLEKPQLYDLLIDLTSAAPNRASRPSFYSSKPVSSGSSKETHKLSSIRFAWSDVRLVRLVSAIIVLYPDSVLFNTSGTS